MVYIIFYDIHIILLNLTLLHLNQSYELDRSKECISYLALISCMLLYTGSIVTYPILIA